jgi:penicillin amidase
MLKGLIVRLFVFALLPACIAAGMAYWHLRSGLPPQESRVHAGVSSDVEITRDPLGVPRIIAANDADAFFAMGYVHAQDRMWQLEVQRRIASGRLSEIFGKGSIQQDIWFRTLGLRHSAQDHWRGLSPEAQASLKAYADGVNAWLATGQALPPEFMLFGVRPERWSVYDSLAWAKVFALDLGANHTYEIQRLLVAKAAGPDILPKLFPGMARTSVSTVQALSNVRFESLAELARFNKTIENDLRIGGRFVGSNAWAVSGKYTADGGALLANDPHLALQVPSIWYMASMKGDKVDVSGATLVGLPLVIFGHNRDIAWGGTNLMADAQDLYFEQTRPGDPSRYAAAGNWVPFTIRNEQIHVRQDFPKLLHSPLRPLQIRVRESRHGPLISDAIGQIGQPAALRWTALDQDDKSYEAIYRLNYARDWPTFQDAMRQYVAPALNLFYADRKGNIGYLGVGRIPIRKQGDGALPVPGWSDEYAWIGSIPFESWPRTYNPDVGILISANNKPVGESYPYLISTDFAAPDRADRIGVMLAELKSSGKPLTLDAMARIQADSRSEPALRLLRRLLQRSPKGERQTEAYRLLREWDGDMRGNEASAAIFNVWTDYLRRLLLADELNRNWNQRTDMKYVLGVVDNIDLDVLGRMLDDEDGRWCDNVATPGKKENCDQVLDRSLNRALAELHKLVGHDRMEQWSWPEMHDTLYKHVPFSQMKVLRSIFQLRARGGGSPDVVNVANFVLTDSRYIQNFGAGVRQLYAMSPDAIEHRYMNSTGQSGNIMSRHYNDMVQPFANVQYATMPGEDKQESGRTILLPLRGPGRHAETPK